ncbi:long-chain-fatty-acid--CoA ligase ACSBG2 [Cherax quadricarinatus]
MGDLEAASEEFRNGPDQILPAVSNKTTAADGAVQLFITDEEAIAEPPFSVYTMLKRKAEEYPQHPALAVKKGGVWRYWTYKQYFEESKTVAKAFIRLGLERFHGVCIMGFNSPEWLIANFGAIYAGGIAAGVYTTNSAEACRHLALNCQAQIILVENQELLNKFLAVKRFLPHIKALIQWEGIPGAPGVLSWAELLAVGMAEPDTLLQDRLSLSAVNQCCTLIYTSGTTGPPKGVMCSQDHLTWGGVQYQVNESNLKTAHEVVVSYLPLSHLAAQMLDIYLACTLAATVFFAQPDALKGSLLETLVEVQPSCVLAVPRVWEKIYEKMQEAASAVGTVKKSLSSWARHHGLNYYTALYEGRSLTRYEKTANALAKKLVLNKVKYALGLSRTKFLCSGGAPISKEILEYFTSLDLPIMEGYGLSESLSICSMSYVEPGKFKFGSVGKILAQTTAKLQTYEGCKRGEGEICMKGRNIFMGYLGLPDETNATIDDEGWLHSGDIGSLDDDGFLYITGRIKELVITAGGENIPPVLIENAVKKHLPFINYAVLIGDKRRYLSMLLTLKSECDENTGEPLPVLTPACQAIMKDIGLQIRTTHEALAEVTANPRGALAELIQRGIERYNEEDAVSNAQRIHKWTLLPQDFSLPTGELNNTLKLKRRFLMEKYKDVIDSMYSLGGELSSKL